MINLQYFDDVAVLHFSGGAAEAHALSLQLAQVKENETAVVVGIVERPGESEAQKLVRTINALSDTMSRHGKTPAHVKVVTPTVPEPKKE